MAFIAETGFGTAGANAYGSVAGFRAYHTARGVAAVDAASINDTAVEVLLIAATDYLDGTFARLLAGRVAYERLVPRVVVSVAAVPQDGDTLAFGGLSLTFRASPSAPTDVQIGAEVSDSLEYLEAALAASGSADLAGYTSDAVSRVALFAASGGVAASASGPRVSVDRAAATGASRRPQPLAWPRLGVYRRGVEVLGVPPEIEWAAYEYAQRARSGALLPDPPVNPSGRRVVESSERVGPLATSQRLGEVESLFSRPYPAADRLLEPFLAVRGDEVIR